MQGPALTRVQASDLLFRRMFCVYGTKLSALSNHPLATGLRLDLPIWQTITSERTEVRDLRKGHESGQLYSDETIVLLLLYQVCT